MTCIVNNPRYGLSIKEKVKNGELSPREGAELLLYHAHDIPSARLSRTYRWLLNQSDFEVARPRRAERPPKEKT